MDTHYATCGLGPFYLPVQFAVSPRLYYVTFYRMPPTCRPGVPPTHLHLHAGNARLPSLCPTAPCRTGTLFVIRAVTCHGCDYYYCYGSAACTTTHRTRLRSAACTTVFIALPFCLRLTRFHTCHVAVSLYLPTGFLAAFPHFARTFCLRTMPYCPTCSPCGSRFLPYGSITFSVLPTCRYNTRTFTAAPAFAFATCLYPDSDSAATAQCIFYTYHHPCLPPILIMRFHIHIPLPLLPGFCCLFSVLPFPMWTLYYRLFCCLQCLNCMLSTTFVLVLDRGFEFSDTMHRYCVSVLPHLPAVPSLTIFCARRTTYLQPVNTTTHHTDCYYHHSAIIPHLFSHLPHIFPLHVVHISTCLPIHILVPFLHSPLPNTCIFCYLGYYHAFYYLILLPSSPILHTPSYYHHTCIPTCPGWLDLHAYHVLRALDPDNFFTAVPFPPYHLTHYALLCYTAARITYLGLLPDYRLLVDRFAAPHTLLTFLFTFTCCCRGSITLPI